MATRWSCLRKIVVLANTWAGRDPILGSSPVTGSQNYVSNSVRVRRIFRDAVRGFLLLALGGLPLVEPFEIGVAESWDHGRSSSHRPPAARMKLSSRLAATG